MTYRIAVDTGGTFSDVVLTDEHGGVWVDKAVTTPTRIFEGVGAALEHAAGRVGLDARGLLSDTEVFVYGTTRSTNAIITGDTAPTAFLTTEGFPDVLTLREGGKHNPFDFRRSYPRAYVPRRLTFEVPERVAADGSVRRPLDEERTRALIRSLPGLGVEAVAVSLLWSIANPVHEERLGELLEEEAPGLPYTLAHRLNPIIREYRRASSTAIDASLKPLMAAHLDEMARDLRAAGFGGQLLVVTSFGGVLEVDDVAARPIYSVNSGPSLAPNAGRLNAPAERDLIVCDMGGTSFDVSVVRDGYVKFTREAWLGEPFIGHITGLSAVDVRSIGAGGGSIAWIDPGGLLHVGPQSAGAVPGPACYGLGGDDPTVTDAAVVLGYLDPDYFLGGRIALDRERAREAVRGGVAEPLGMSVERAAWAILSVANEHMVTAIREITVNDGIDPRDCLVVAGGGAGGMTIGRILEELGVPRVLVPRTAGALSATGAVFSDAVAEFSLSRRSDTDDFDADAVNAGLEGLEAQMDAFLDGLGTPPARRRKEFFVEARYPYQVWELEVPLTASRFAGPEDVQRMTAAFHAVHERVFAVSEPGQQIECIYWKGRATALLERPSRACPAPAEGPLPAPRSDAGAFFGDDEPRPTPRHHGEDLAPGHALRGPAIVEEDTTTVVVYPGWSLLVDPDGNYELTREGSGA
jgi:N-methylhydantoinase A